MSYEQHKAAVGRQASAVAQPADGAGKDAPPTNRASHTCNEEGSFKPLRWGVDSLYLSYPGELRREIENELERLKALAQSSETHKQALAQLSVEGHLFEVKDKGARLFPFILEDNAFRVQLSRSKAKSMPMAYVKISSDYLAHVGPHEAENRLSAILRAFGEPQAANVSRIDVYADFVSGFDMEGWTRQSWVTRASAINAYSVDGRFSGWTVGQGSDISGRLYDKTLEILVKRYRDYLPEVWRAGGWNGEDRVWRCEFQFRREVLGQHGLKGFLQVMDNLNGLWSYATTEWLRLTLPNLEDKTRSRWPIHPLWTYIASIDWATPGGPLSRRYSLARLPGEAYLYGRGLSALIAFMAREGITEYQEGIARYAARLRSYHENLCFEFVGVPFDQYIGEKVAVKAREFNTILNADPEARARAEASARRDKEDYERESDGEGYV